MADSRNIEDTSTNYVELREDAGKQSAEIALTNAVMINNRLAAECFGRELYSIYYSLQHLASYLEAAQKHSSENTSANIN